MGLRERFESKVQRTDDHWWWTGALRNGYGVLWNGTYTARGNPRTSYAHRIAYELHVGLVPEGMEIDHRCHEPGCVRPDHLRVLTHQQNTANRAGAERTSTTGVRGVVRLKNGRYRPAVKVWGRFHYRGSYVTLQEAARVADQMRREFFPHLE